MHSRRPPSLRHKGNRRELQKNKNLEQEHGDSEQQEQKIAVAPTRKKRKTGVYSTGACVLVVVLLVLGFYAKFIHSTASFRGKGLYSEGSVRGSLGMNSLPSLTPAEAQGKLRSSTNGGEKTTGTEHSGVDGAEEQQWKELVKDQTTKEEGQIPEVVSVTK
jgi:hypothetical protein